MFGRRLTGTLHPGSTSTKSTTTSGTPNDQPLQGTNPTAPTNTSAAAAAVEADSADHQVSSDVNTATHIVVEHDISGTVKTHVFSSKDGKPSLLGHTIPDLRNSTTSSNLEEKIQNLSTLVQDSIDRSKLESFEKIDALRISLEEKQSRVASQVSLATTCTVENQIKTNLIPKLDKLELLLLSNNMEKEGKSKSSKSSRISIVGKEEEEDNDRRSTSQSMDPRILDKSKDNQVDGQSSTHSIRATENLSLSNPMLLEKLSTIESNVDALCKVVIDGQLPPLPLGDELDPKFSVDNQASVDLNAIDKLGTMRDEMLTFPETLKNVHSTMQELVEALANPQGITTSKERAEENIQRAHEEQKQWQSAMLQVINIQTDELDNLSSDFQSLETGFNNMNIEFHDWRKAHKLSLQVYLKYMYWIFKRTESVDTRIQKAIEELKEQAKIGPEQRIQFYNDLDALRSEVFALLHRLPDMIVTQLQHANESQDLAQAQQSVIVGQSENNDVLTPVGPAAESSHELGRRVLGTPRLKLTTKLVSDVESDQKDQESTDTSIQPKSDSVLNKLLQTVETLQASITSMMEKYAVLVSRAPIPTLAESTSTSVIGEKTELSQEELIEGSALRPGETDIERRIRAIEERIIQPSPNETGTTPTTNETATDVAASSDIADVQIPPASGYIHQSLVDNGTKNDSTNDPVVLTEETNVGSMTGTDNGSTPPILSTQLVQDLEAMNRNLEQLLDIVKNTTGSLAQGQNQLNENMLSQIQRVITAVESLEAESPNVIEKPVESTSRQGTARAKDMNSDQLNVLGGLMKEITDVKVFTSGLENKLVSCHNDVKNVLQGSMQDSSVIGAIKGCIDTIISDRGCASDVFLKGQVAEVIRTATDVYVMVEDVKKISNKALSHQEVLSRKLDGLQKKHDEGVEASHKKYDDGWGIWNERTTQVVANIEEWHDKHDKDLRDLDEWRNIHREEVQSWHRSHDNTLESWNKTYDEHLAELGKRFCSCCTSNPTPEVEASETEAEVPGSARRAAPVISAETNQDQLSENSRPPSENIREMFEEFLRDNIPGYNGACFQCGHLGSSKSSKSIISNTTSGVIVPEPSRFEEASSVASTIQSYYTPGSFRDTPINLPTQAQYESQTSLPLESEGQVPREMGESASYQGPTTDFHLTTRNPLPQELYDLLKPYFQTETTSFGLGQGQECQQDETVKLSNVQKELSVLQEKYAALTVEYEKSEASIDRYMAALISKGQEIIIMTSERERIERELEERTLFMDQEVAKLKEKLASKKQKLRDTNAKIEQLYREGFGLSTGILAEELQEGVIQDDLLSKNNDNNQFESDMDLIKTVRIPRYSLMTEAAEQFQQTLEEFKLQKAGLYHDIGMLEAKRVQLLEEIAVIETNEPHHTLETGRRGHELESEEDNSEDDHEEFVDTTEQHQQQPESTASRSLSSSFSASTRGYHSTVGQQKCASLRSDRSNSRGQSDAPASIKIPQLEADIKICKDGNISETLLSSKTLLTEDQFDRIQHKKSEAKDEVWSLSCDFKVRMVNA
ncbi:hypothetical protein BGZ46_005046 [Entomortierella lignicola]|nr:hypothetical protein BGZ46_005046 [Entomortierella lignicola]